MFFLIDENLPNSLSEVFTNRGHSVECTRELEQLQGQSDEVVFNYAVANKAIIVTRDLGFTNPFDFDLSKLTGIVVLRFPNQLSIKILKTEVTRLTEGLTDLDFRQLVIIEPGSIRTRKI